LPKSDAPPPLIAALFAPAGRLLPPGLTPHAPRFVSELPGPLPPPPPPELHTVSTPNAS
jgi:hypothetical protein